MGGMHRKNYLHEWLKIHLVYAGNYSMHAADGIFTKNLKCFPTAGFGWDLVVAFNHIDFVRCLLAQALLDDTCDACLSGKTASSPKKLKQTHHSKPQGKRVINQKKSSL